MCAVASLDAFVLCSQPPFLIGEFIAAEFAAMRV
jgi:hypothetical protein